MPRIDRDMVVRMAEVGLTYQEIASVLGVPVARLTRKYRKDIELGHQKRNASLRRRQYEMAMSGDVKMLIWLGKQYLDQKDKLEETRVDDPLAELLAEFRRQSESLEGGKQKQRVSATVSVEDTKALPAGGESC